MDIRIRKIHTFRRILLPNEGMQTTNEVNRATGLGRYSLAAISLSSNPTVIAFSYIMETIVPYGLSFRYSSPSLMLKRLK